MLRGAWLSLLLAAQSAGSPQIPVQLRGDWVVTHTIPTTTISCWDDSQAEKLLGTTVHYSAEGFSWRTHVVLHTTVGVQTLSAKQFHDEDSGGGAADSYVDFSQLGIKEPTVVVVQIRHDRAHITGATIEVPGDWVLLKNSNTVIFSVCNVYFEARRR